MTDEEIRDKIFDIFAKEAKLDRESLTLDAKLEDLDIESLDMVQILFGIEETFDVYVPQDDESFKLETMRDVVDGVKDLVAQKENA
ncbi:MAG: phosphopantetheine-binding protein [Bauldia litoralis]